MSVTAHIQDAYLDSYLHKRLDATTVAGIQSHLRQCQICGEKMASMVIAQLAELSHGPQGRAEDRRKDERFPKDDWGWLQMLCPLSLDQSSIQFLNFSKYGMGLLTSTALPSGAIVHVKDGTNDMLGEVRHCRSAGEGKFYAGIQRRTVEKVKRRVARLEAGTEMRANHSSERGQALVAFVLAFGVLLGMLALVLDVGWAFFIGKKAQAATDAGAIAAVMTALAENGQDATPQCGTLACQTAAVCPGAGNLTVACEYATANGFTTGADSGRQTVQVAAGDTNPVPGAPNVPVDYWVQVTAQYALPQWFSGMFTNHGLTATAQSVAALRHTSLTSSVYLLNRSSDCFASLLSIGLVCGSDFLALGGNTLNAGGGIYMSSSNGPGLGLPGMAAGSVTGVATVTAPFTYLMGNGTIQDLLGGDSWTSAPKNGFADGDYFTDPFAGRSQPPVPTGLANHPVPLGVITGSLNPANPTVLAPGNYYSTLPLLGTATGLPITITGNVIFSDGAGTPCGGFCNYVFYGGIVTGPLSQVTLAPGRYVFAGAQPVAGLPGVGLTVGAGAVLKDMTPLSGGVITQNSDAGEIFIFTDTHFPGLTLPSAISSSGLSFPQVQAGIMAGLEPVITLHGLNGSSSAVPAELRGYAPILIWQDRANTTLKYQSNGLLDTSCGGICSNILSVPGSQQMIIMASQNGGHAGTNLYGTIYGPRGTWLTILGLLPGDTVAGPLQIVTGSLQMVLNSKLTVDPLPNPPTRIVAGLIN